MNLDRAIISTFLMLLFVLESRNAAASSAPPYPEGDWSAVSEILKKGVNSARWRDPHGHSIVYFQMIYGSEVLAARYLRLQPRKSGRLEGDQRLLTLAILQGSQQVVRALLSTGESPNSMKQDEESPLMLATTYGHLEIMRMLIRAKADLSFSTGVEVDALYRALTSGNYFAASLLVDSGLRLEQYKFRPNEGGLIFHAIKGGSEDAVRLIISYGFHLNIPNAEGETPVTYAVLTGANRRVMELLIVNEADPCERNANGDLPYEIARRSVAHSEASHQLYEGILQKDCKNPLLKPSLIR